MLRYIIMFVLVMIMVKTNAQPLGGTESDDILMVKLIEGATSTDIADVLAKVSNDVDFDTYSDGKIGYLFLERTTNSTISKQDAIDNYMGEDYVAYASFVYELDDGFYGVANDVFVRAHSSVTSQQVENAANSLGAVDIEERVPVNNIYLIHFDKQGNTIDRIDDLIQTGLFEYVEPNYVTTLLKLDYIGDRTTSGQNCSQHLWQNTYDSYMADRSQWSLYTDDQFNWNTNFMVSGSVPWSDINICHAWASQQGSANGTIVSGNGINVAVIDDGVDATHYDLNIRMNGSVAYGCDAIGRNNPINAHPGAPDVNAKHGTMCAGVVAARRNNTNAPSSLYSNPNHGMAGIAYDAQIMPVRVTSYGPLPGGGTGYIWTVAAIDYSFRWAADNGADVISCSWGGYIAGGSVVDDAIQYAVTYGRGGNPATGHVGKGCVIVFSSGNNNCSNINWPSSNTNTIAVGASTMCNQKKEAGQAGYPPIPCFHANNNNVSCDGELSWGSNYGSGSPVYDPINLKYHNTGNKLSVLAPGVKIVSTLPGNLFSTTFNGTSSAAPHVSGVVALMLSVNTCLTYVEAKDIIEISADKIVPAITDQFYTSYSYQPVAGEAFKSYCDRAGHGKVNAGNAVALAYDTYLQGVVETGAKTYYASHYIFAGDVTDLKQHPGLVVTPYYTVQSGADVDFYVQNGQGIVLTPGFLAEFGSDFLADPDVAIPCDNDQGHFKPGKKDKNEINPSGKKPILSSSDNLLHGIKVYPNPAKETINIEFMLEGDADVSFTMLNMLGQKMKETETTGLAKGMQKQQISLQGLTPGVYFVGIKTPAGYSQFRFIKE